MKSCSFSCQPDGSDLNIGTFHHPSKNMIVNIQDQIEQCKAVHSFISRGLLPNKVQVTPGKQICLNYQCCVWFVCLIQQALSDFQHVSIYVLMCLYFLTFI